MTERGVGAHTQMDVGVTCCRTHGRFAFGVMRTLFCVNRLEGGAGHRASGATVIVRKTLRAPTVGGVRVATGCTRVENFPDPERKVAPLPKILWQSSGGEEEMVRSRWAKKKS